MTKFRPGDLVRVKEGTHQEGMPDHRVGVIIQENDKRHDYTPDIVQLLFLGQTEPLRFHVVFLEHLTSS
jgi:hypothetical protein